MEMLDSMTLENKTIFLGKDNRWRLKSKDGKGEPNMGRGNVNVKSV